MYFLILRGIQQIFLKSIKAMSKEQEFERASQKTNLIPSTSDTDTVHESHYLAHCCKVPFAWCTLPHSILFIIHR